MTRSTLNRLNGLIVLSLLATPPAIHAGSLTDFLFSADGGQEVPPIETEATGGCFAVLDEPASQLNITCAHTVLNATAAHIHAGEPGVSGPIVFNLGDPSVSPFFAALPNLSAAQISDLLAGNFYVNIHSPTHPAGELRGQIVEPAVLRFRASLDQAESVPPTGSEAAGQCSATLNDPPTMLSVACAHTVFMPKAAHIHRGAAGTNGPVVFDLGDPASPLSVSFTTNPEDLAELAARLFYINVHSGVFPDGELRGQLSTDQIFADGFESGNTSSWSGTLRGW